MKQELSTCSYINKTGMLGTASLIVGRHIPVELTLTCLTDRMIFSVISIHSNHATTRLKCCFIFPSLNWTSGARCYSSTVGNDSAPPEFRGENAYDILGVSETSSFSEIKASFRKLAKETHPDLADSPASHHRFIQILAAYEILSDSERRAHYDSYLSSQRKLMEKSSRQGSTLYTYTSRMSAGNEMEVVEWLKWYRLAVNDVLSEKKVAVGDSYFDVLEADFYSAIQAAYYGPEIESWDLLPDRFEAEVRSVCETHEVLHLVSGCDLFGMVCVANKIPKSSSSSYAQRLNSFTSVGLEMCQYVKNSNVMSSTIGGDGGSQMNAGSSLGHTSDAYEDLELHLLGKVVAVATRIPPDGQYDGRKSDEDENQDQIHVYLTSTDSNKHSSRGIFLDDAVGAKIPLGTILGLGTIPEEGSCFVYGSDGTKTHVLMKHRTLMVKHMHWYGVGDKVGICECRCTRARLPPSKFWLFEPRCSMHDIGGWYVETFGRDKKGRTVPSQRYWDGIDGSEQHDKRLHPAMYLLALAYRTLDMEDAKRKKWIARRFVEGHLQRILHWCKKLV